MAYFACIRVYVYCEVSSSHVMYEVYSGHVMFGKYVNGGSIVIPLTQS